jgi:DNA processing protein
VTTLPISAEGQAVALAASSLALKSERSLKPLSAPEWHDLSLMIQRVELRPRNLLGMDGADLRDQLGIESGLADRLARLLSRGGQLALEVERLSSLGIWILTRADESYPALLKQRLRRHAPPVLFGAGPQGALGIPAIAIVGSRDVDEEGLRYAAQLGGLCAEQYLAVVSGAARGVDSAAMQGALERGGTAVGVTVDSLEKLVRRRDYRMAISEEQLTLMTPFHPSMRWYASNAMRRNRLIYALAESAVVVASSVEKGGTRSGALENLQAEWVPLHVRDDGSPGNRALISAGASPLPPNEMNLQLVDLARHRRPSLLDMDQGASEPPPRQSSEADQSPNGTPKSGDAFALIWPLMAQHLAEPRSEREIANQLDLELTQARAWLKRGVAEGLAEVSTRPKRYVSRMVNDEQLRISGA